MTVTTDAKPYTERLWPSIPFFIALLLIIPSVTILLTPFSLEGGFIAGISTYLLVCTIFLVSARRISVENGRFIAGRAQIPVDQLGGITVLDKHQLRLAIGRRLDARAFLVISGWIHSGLRIEVIDPDDPTPYWVITSRRPDALAQAIEDHKTSTGA